MTILILLLGLSIDHSYIPQQTYIIIGNIRDSSGQSVGNLRVSVSDENMAPIRTVIADSAGNFKVPGLRVGTYMIHIETTGTPYQEQVHRIELQSGRRRAGSEEPYPMDFVLRFRERKKDIARKDNVFAQTVPDAARVEYDRAVKSLKGNKNEQAIVSLRKAIEIFPDYYDALELLGIEYLKIAQHADALPLLTRALELNQRAPKSLYGLGVACLNMNRLPEAIEHLENSAKLEANNPNTLMMLGLAYGNSRLFDKSESFFTKALAIGGTGTAEAHFYLASLYNKQEKYRKAWQELELYLKEEKNIKDTGQIKTMIEKLKDKEKTQGSK